jgi:hypothetical protein
MPIACIGGSEPAGAQSRPIAISAENPVAPVLSDLNLSASGFNSAAGNGGGSALPESPEPATGGTADEPANVPWAEKQHYQPLSRVGIGANVSPLGIGIQSATILTQYFDARLMGNFFNYTTGKFEIEGFDAHANFHLASVAASLDWYPLDSVWRLSVGGLLYNGNQIKMNSEIVPGTSFTLNGTNFYAATANPASGVTPLTATGVLGFHAHEPAFTVSGGFGRFVPRSKRHWSFPSEFGVAFTGPPTISVNPAGWVCTDKAETNCSNIGDASNPVAMQFNDALQATLTKWRKGLSSVQVYPLFSYSVVYSFDVR